MEIIFIRHGRSKADDERKHEGRYDSPLTNVGREQVNKRAESIKNKDIKINKIITSPLKRAKETAEIIAKSLKCEIEVDNDWIEFDNGLLAELTYKEADKKYPKPKFRNPYQRIAKGSGESSWHLHSRSIKALEKIIQKPENNYLVVAHGGILNATIRMIVGAQPPINDSGLFFQFGDTGYLHIEYNSKKHIWLIKEFNSGIKT